MTLKERMLLYRAKERITQGELAKRCGLSVGTISGIESGIQDPSEKTRIQIELVVGGMDYGSERFENKNV